jgi:peptidoglycan/xylan/chitin deacetylase (PgdA/CDA1 family)
VSFEWPEGQAVAVSLTFDDARPSQIETGLPVLDKYGIRATFYAVPGNVEARREGWRALAGAGHEIGNHTVTHPCSTNFSWSRENGLEEYTLSRMERELLDCNLLLQELCGVTPETFAYPCGETFVGRGRKHRSYVPLVARHFLAGRGYHGECHNVPAVCDLAHLKGYPFDQASLETLLTWIDRAKEERGWVVLVGHDVVREDRHQGVRLDVLKALCEYAREHEDEVWFAPVAEVARHVKSSRGR